MKNVPMFLRVTHQLFGLALAVAFTWGVYHVSQPAIAEEPSPPLTFDSSALPQVELRIPKKPKPKLIAMVSEALHGSPEPESDKQKMLDKACDGDAQCICVVDKIAIMDSSWATAGIGKRTLNPCNLRPPSSWKFPVPYTAYQAKGNGYFAHFETLQDGVTACAATYNKYYRDMSPRQLVKVWAQSSNQNYVNMVATCFR